MRFSALVVVGDGNGVRSGIGMAKAAEVPEAIRKAEGLARRTMIKIPRSEFSIPHEVEGVFGKSKVLMRPRPKAPALSRAAASARS